VTVADLINSAAKALGKLRAGGGLNPSELADGLGVLNALVDYWLTRKAFVYTTRMDLYTFSDKAAPDNNQPAVYQLGPGSADWPGSVRPTHIENANICLNDQVPGVFIPLQILDSDQWAAITLEQMPVTLPTKLYCDYAFPNANLYFWGQPTLPYLLRLFTWQQIAAFTGLAQTIALPPGYYAAFLYTFAELVAAQWSVPVPAMVSQQAMKARAGIVGLNSAAPKLRTKDSGMPDSGPRGTSFNYRTRGF
jgi:hypothetical protein